MDKIKTQTLKGFRDFLPREARKRQYVIDTLRRVFESYGFEPLETPALEYAETLTGKYGSEAEKLIYLFKDRGGREVGLRYDLTVPLARVIAQYKNELPLPFERYQIAPVWRADKPQAGRYREFWQADIDIVGSSSPIADAKVVACLLKCMDKLGFKDYLLLINDRKIFSANNINEVQIIRELDKLPPAPDSLPGEEVIKIFRREKNMTQEEAEKFARDFMLTKEPRSVTEIKDQVVKLGGDKSKIRFMPWLARGLDYYTGIIFELQARGYKNLSIGGGGRYDKLLDMPAVGFSFGIDRVIEALESNGLPTKPSEFVPEVLVTVFNKDLAPKSLATVYRLQQEGFNVALYPNAETKLDKQLKYADNRGSASVVIIGPKEAAAGTVTVRDMQTGTEKEVPQDKLVETLRG